MSTEVDWSVWQGLLKTGKSPKPDSPIAAGFWRLPNGLAGTALPVATWSEDGFWMAAINDADPIDKDCGPVWKEFLAKTWPKLVAVQHDAYQASINDGTWPDGTPVKKDRGGMGDNAPPEGSVEALLQEASGHLESARNLVKAGAAKTSEDADIASNFAKTLTETRSKVEAAHKVEKAPHLEAGRVVDNKFLPVADSLKKAAAAVKDRVINPFQIEQERLRELEAERQRKAAQEAQASGSEPPPPPAPEKVSSGSRGRKTTLVDRRYGEIADPEAFGAWLGKLKHPTIISGMEAAANSLARNPEYAIGSSPAPGVIVRSKKVSV